MSTLRVAVYPGTFDPITNGHVDIITRAARMLDRLIVAVAANTGKAPLFTLDERVKMVEEETAAMCDSVPSRIEVRAFDNLLMDFVVGMDASMIVRGLRAVSDFEYEFQMTGMNARLNADVETVFLMASENHQFIASRLVKEIGRLGGEIGQFVSPSVETRLKTRFAELRGK